MKQHNEIYVEVRHSVTALKYACALQSHMIPQADDVKEPTLIHHKVKNAQQPQIFHFWPKKIRDKLEPILKEIWFTIPVHRYFLLLQNHLKKKTLVNC